MHLRVQKKEGNLVDSSETLSLSSRKSLNFSYTPCWVNVLWNYFEISVFLPGAAQTLGMSHSACVRTAIFVSVNERKVVVSTDGHWLARSRLCITFPKFCCHRNQQSVTSDLDRCTRRPAVAPMVQLQRLQFVVHFTTFPILLRLYSPLLGLGRFLSSLIYT
jgi:hypothetical protein